MWGESRVLQLCPSSLGLPICWLASKFFWNILCVFLCLKAFPILYLGNNCCSCLRTGWHGWCFSIQIWVSVEQNDWWSTPLWLWRLRVVVFRSGRRIMTQRIVSLRLWIQTCMSYVKPYPSTQLPSECVWWLCFHCFCYSSNRNVWGTGFQPACLATYTRYVLTWEWSMWPSTWSSSVRWSMMLSSVTRCAVLYNVA